MDLISWTSLAIERFVRNFLLLILLSVNMHYLIYELLLHLHMYFCTITCTYYMIFLKIEFGHNSVGKEMMKNEGFTEQICTGQCLRVLANGV